LTKHKKTPVAPIDDAPRIKCFTELVKDKQYIATGIDDSVVLTYVGESDNDGHTFEGDDWIVKGYLFAKTTMKLISFGLVELNYETATQTTG
jgi:hypothetical protein